MCSLLCVQLVYTQPVIAIYKGLYHGCSCGRHIYSVRTGRQLKNSKSGRVFVTDVNVCRSWQHPQDICPPVQYHDQDTGADSDSNADTDDADDDRDASVKSFARSTCVAIFDAFVCMGACVIFSVMITQAWPADVVSTDFL